MHSDLTESRRSLKLQIMLQMTEEEKQKIEALLKQCRRQTSEIEQDQKDWEERNKAMKAEQECQQRKSQ